mmetsp:Transcript_164187/g.526537  ORF Transcript_164187/g.526537 Transcript_164187/m.526537 type:complete len:287 (-) Transcript_164187:257-1117(-)
MQHASLLCLLRGRLLGVALVVLLLALLLALRLLRVQLHAPHALRAGPLLLREQIQVTDVKLGGLWAARHLLCPSLGDFEEGADAQPAAEVPAPLPRDPQHLAQVAAGAGPRTRQEAMRHEADLAPRQWHRGVQEPAAHPVVARLEATEFDDLAVNDVCPHDEQHRGPLSADGNLQARPHLLEVRVKGRSAGTSCQAHLVGGAPAKRAQSRDLGGILFHRGPGDADGAAVPRAWCAHGLAETAIGGGDGRKLCQHRYEEAQHGPEPLVVQPRQDRGPSSAAPGPPRN